MIKPTVGRKVWYRPSVEDKAGIFGMAQYGNQPLDATIIAVWSERCVNLSVTDSAGKVFTVTSCTLLQPGDPLPGRPLPEGCDTDEVPGRYAEWPSYQYALAAKVEQPAPAV